MVRKSEIKHDKAVAPPPFLSSVPDHCPGTPSLRLFSLLRIVDPNTLAPHSPGTSPSSRSRSDKVFYRENETLPLFSRYVELLLSDCFCCIMLYISIQAADWLALRSQNDS